MIPYAIGLDVGITSVGWAAVALDENDAPCGILDMGVRIFDIAESSKGKSLSAPRREARGVRRRLRRRRHRKERIRALLVSAGILSQKELDSLFQGHLENIYALRVRALDEPVTPREFARILLHLSQRRGFRSNRKGAASKEDGKLLIAVKANKSNMKEHGYRTAAEMFLRDERYQDHQRNKGGNYLGTISRDMVEAEAREIFAAQRRFGCAFASTDIENVYLDILLGQRSFDAGPACGPYSGNQIKKMWGYCTFEDGELRAAKASYSFEYFRLLDDVNHIRLIEGGNSIPLNGEQRQKLLDLAHKSDNLDYAKIRKELQIPEEQRFNMVSYDRTGKVTPGDAEKKKKFSHLRAYHQMRAAFDKNVSKGYFSSFTVEQRNTLGWVLSIYKSPENIREKLRDAGFSPCDIEIAETLNFSGAGHLSVKACEKIIPYLEQGMRYNDACEAAGYDFRAHADTIKDRYLPALCDREKVSDRERASITSPVVLRAVAQTRKVLNAIIRERGGSPVYINIELAREMAKNKDERDKMQKGMEENQRKNDKIREEIQEHYGITSPSGTDIVKLRLYHEQGGMCPYSVRQLSYERLLEPGYAEIDHIIPYSISFDDGYKNKVLVFAEENRNKSDRLPLEYLEGERREKFFEWVNNNVHDTEKHRRLLKEKLTPEERREWKERNLQDTKTMSRFLLNYIRDHLEFAPFSSGKTDSEMTQGRKHVTSVNGQMTAELRKHWGIRKIRADGDQHHAVDALVIACTTEGMIRKASTYWKYRERRYQKDEQTPQAAELVFQQDENGGLLVNPETGEAVKGFPYPWPCFRKELESHLGSDPQRTVLEQRFPLYLSGEVTARPLFVSRVPRRKVTGPAHKETVKSPKALQDGVLISRKSLTSLKLNAKTGEIDNYYNPDSDRLLYEALKARLRQFDGDGKKAFAEPFHKPKRDGTPGPIVGKVKLCERSSHYVPVHKGTGAADYGPMIRIDVFHVEGDGYYFVPIYVADTLKEELPNMACVQGKPYSEWKEMREENFIFSLYHNDLIRVTQKKELTLPKAQKTEDSDLPDSMTATNILLYYSSANRATGTISVRTHDNSYKMDSLGIKTLEKLEKYTVDVLGHCFPVKHETRQHFHRQDRK